MRIAVWVQTGSARPGVGGDHDGALVVRVSKRPVAGEATEATRAALAVAFGVSRSDVALISGVRGRSKIFEVVGADPALLSRLLGGQVAR
jgi:uncharacterized protein